MKRNASLLSGPADERVRFAASVVPAPREAAVSSPRNANVQIAARTELQSRFETKNMLQEPGVSQYDLQFSFLGFPVRVAWGFWVVAAILGWHWSEGVDSLGRLPGFDSPGAPMLLVLWIGAVFLSILVHELGHALVMRYYGVHSRIVLYHFGGLAIPDSFGSWNAARRRNVGPREQLAISAAGPGLQLLLALLVWLLGLTLGVRMELSEWFNRWIGNGMGIELGNPNLPNSVALYAIFDAILYPSFAWAILNLAPILPLDGGQITRNGLMLTNTPDPTKIAHMVSVGAGVLIGIYFLRGGEPFGIMFLIFAASNWQAMQIGSRGF